ncbi:MAG TPA: zinc ribbon domain-containing protein [Verrucomicrobiota bacterium]|nr:zinc ribbon domain-containing protein [Verrucomicrobiota bacterium]HNT13558.1 zinc ribbon domain-containing protein [Verrucomicrobiota bacterium]
MPTYQYQCSKCGRQFEVRQSMKDKPLTKCQLPAGRTKRRCGGPVHRLIGAGAGLIFKGSGFYITDYRSEGYKQAAKKDAEAKSASTNGATKSATKSAATPAKPAAKT